MKTLLSIGLFFFLLFFFTFCNNKKKVALNTNPTGITASLDDTDLGLFNSRDSAIMYGEDTSTGASSLTIEGWKGKKGESDGIGFVVICYNRSKMSKGLYCDSNITLAGISYNTYVYPHVKDYYVSVGNKLGKGTSINITSLDSSSIQGYFYTKVKIEPDNRIGHLDSIAKHDTVEGTHIFKGRFNLPVTYTNQ